MLRKCLKLLCLAVVIAMQLNVGATEAQQPGDVAPKTYTNPINLGNMGDPYVLRWNGRYYLYPTVGGQGLRTWISDDLVNWRHVGLVAQEPVARGAYAPEVVYWNGTFYMYISRDKDGHYVLKSDSPTGPFLQQTNTLGLNIDGSVFFDNDGQWYFTHAAGRGIRGHKMLDPYKIGAEVRLNSDLGGWTEGPGIIQRNGVYFMTYTGNHFLSKGYRVEYSVSEQGPLGPYEVAQNNPIILSTEDDFSGLGHNSNVMGPDLDSLYAVYHNRQVNWGSAIRLMNVDRYVFNGKKMDVLGPTNWQQQAPKMADFYTWIDEDGLGDRWTEAASSDLSLLVSAAKTGSDYTAEFNFLVQSQPSVPGALIGAVISYQDPSNFVYAGVDVAKQVLNAVAVQKGQSHQLGSAQLPSDFDFTKLHTIRVEKSGSKAAVVFDTMRKLEVDLSDVTGGSIGYVSRGVKPVYRYTAFSNDAAGSSDYDAYKPVPGEIEAVHYLKTDGYYVSVPSVGNPLRPGNGTIIKSIDDVYSVRMASAGDWLKYNLNVEKAGLHGVDFLIKASGEAKVELLVDGVPAQEMVVTVPAGIGGADWAKVRAGFVNLPSGFHTLVVKLVHGEFEFRTMSLYQANLDAFSIVEPLTKGVERSWTYHGAPNWTSNEQGYKLASSGNSMVLIGDSRWTDYTIEADVKLDTVASGEIGLLLRATNASYYESQVVDSMSGYYVALNGQQISLKRLNYNSQTLQKADVPPLTGQYGHLKVEAVAGNFRVYWGDMTVPVIDYTDPNAFTYGAIGLRSSRFDAVLRNLVIQCASCSVYGRLQVVGQSLWIQPHIKEYDITLPFDAVDVPQVAVVPLPEGGSVRPLVPDARLVVTQAKTIPGVALIQVLQPDNTELHSLKIAINRDTMPIVALSSANIRQGTVSGTALFDIKLNGPDTLFTKGIATLSGTVQGNSITPRTLYAGQSLPHNISLDTLKLEDGIYQLVVSVGSVYGTSAQTSLEFAVRNWNEVIDDLEPPNDTGWFGAVSNDKTSAKSAGWIYATGKSEEFFGDDNRLMATEQGNQYLVWEAPELREFVITVYSHSESVEGKLTVAFSDDMKKWTPAPYSVEVLGTSSTGWRQLRISGEVAVAAGPNYLRLSVSPKSEADTGLQVGQVQMKMQMQAGN